MDDSLSLFTILVSIILIGLGIVLSAPVSSFFVFLGGFLLLVRGSDLFVESASRIAKTLGVSEFVIGLTIIAIGTSLPELLTGITSALTDNPKLAAGAVVGSNITNICLILGLVSVLSLILIKKDIFYRDCYILLGISFIFYFFAFNDGVIDRIEGLILVLFFIFYLGFLFHVKPRFSALYRFEEYLDYIYDFDTVVDFATYKKILRNGLDLKTHKRLVKGGLKMGWKLGTVPLSLAVKGLDKKNYVDLLDSYKERLRKGLIRDVIIFLSSCAFIYIGVKYFVGGAVEIAEFLNIDNSIIGLTLVSIGTSLPELVISIESVRKGFSNMVLGNVIGSNIANTTLVMGSAAILTPIKIIDFSILYVIPFMLIVTFLLLVFIRSGWHIRKWEGAAFLILYLGFLISMVVFAS